MFSMIYALLSVGIINGSGLVAEITIDHLYFILQFLGFILLCFILITGSKIDMNKDDTVSITYKDKEAEKKLKEDLEVYKHRNEKRYD